MKKRLFTIMLAGIMAVGMTTGSVQAAAAEDASGDLYVFIAASLSNAMDEIQKDFNEEYPDVNILFNADSSGTLQTQIEEGSRCDIFFSAATKQMDALVDEDLAKKDSVVDLLENKVVLIKPKDGETKVTGFENITDAENIALAGEDVPVGQYSREIFKNLGIEDDVNKMEINEGKNVTDVLASVSEGSNEIGIVYATDAASVADKVDIIAEAPEGSLETPVLYPAGLTVDAEASDEEAAAADAFLAYLQTDDAMKVFEEYGFAAYKEDDKKDEADKDAETTEEPQSFTVNRCQHKITYKRGGIFVSPLFAHTERQRRKENGIFAGNKLESPVDFFKDRCGGYTYCLFFWNFLRPQDHEDETDIQGNLGWNINYAAGIASDSCRLLFVIDFQSQKTIRQISTDEF